MTRAQVSQPRYCACGTRLARDNRGKRCGACQKTASSHVVRASEAPASFWRCPELRDALKSWHIGRVIRAYRRHEHWPEPISQAVVANWLGITQAQLSRIENGGAVTDLAKLIPIAHTLRIPADLLWFRLPAETPGGSEAARVTGSADLVATTDDGPGDGLEALPSETNEEDAVTRRRGLLQGILAGAGGTLTASALKNLAILDHVGRSLDRIFEGSAVSAATLERWESLPSEYGQRYQVVAPARLLSDVAGDFVELQYLLSLTEATKSRKALCRVSSQLAALAGIFFAAQGNKDSAQNWFRTAGLAAAEAEDSQLAGLALARSAIVWLYHGSPEHALAKLARAHVLLGPNPTPWRARALVVEARSLARLGRRKEAVGCLAKAEASFEDMPASALNDPALGYAERQLYFTLGNAYTSLGMTHEAEVVLSRALEMYRPAEYLDPALIQLDQSTCLVKRGDVGSACQKATVAIAAVPSEHRGLVAHYGRGFLAELPPTAAATADRRDLKALLTTVERTV